MTSLQRPGPGGEKGALKLHRPLAPGSRGGVQGELGTPKHLSWVL